MLLPLFHCGGSVTCRIGRHSICMRACVQRARLFLWSALGTASGVLLTSAMFTPFFHAVNTIRSSAYSCKFCLLQRHHSTCSSNMGLLLRQQLCPSNRNAAMSHQGHSHHDFIPCLNMFPQRCGMCCDVLPPEAPS